MRIVISIILIILVVFANIFAVKAMTIYAVEVIAYEKLSVAYDIGGMDGLSLELARVLSQSEFKHELETAKKFRDSLDGLKDPGVFLKGVISEKKKAAIFLNSMRQFAMILITILIGVKILLNIKYKGGS